MSNRKTKIQTSLNIWIIEKDFEWMYLFYLKMLKIWAKKQQIQKLHYWFRKEPAINFSAENCISVLPIKILLNISTLKENISTLTVKALFIKISEKS